MFLIKYFFKWEKRGGNLKYKHSKLKIFKTLNQNQNRTKRLRKNFPQVVFTSNQCLGKKTPKTLSFNCKNEILLNKFKII